MSRFLIAIFAMFLSGIVQATITIPIYWVSASGLGDRVGTIKVDDTIYGVLFTPNLKGLPKGVRGIHVHELPFCSNYARAAGGHLDPEHNDQHQGPYEGNGHLGDLPILAVDEKGRATLPILAPRLKLASIKDKALVIDSGGDNYSDYPHKNGGGGERIACGVVPYF